MTRNIESVNITDTSIRQPTEFGERILLLLKQQGRSQDWLAKKIGLSKQALYYQIYNGSKPRYVNDIALALDVNPEWLETGQGGMVKLVDDNLGVRHVPLFSMLATAKPEADPLDFIPVLSSYPNSSFAVRLENPSMEPKFAMGSILIFDAKQKPRSGDYIIFVLSDTDEVFFRQYFLDGKDIYLNSVDTTYKSFRNPKMKIIGVLLESRNEFKQMA
jgi:SOS-response transcriptional repressor LexA